MFVFSVKSSQIKLIALILAVVLAVAALLYMSERKNPVAGNSGISLKAGNAAERVAFLSQFGWKIDEDPLEVSEIIIPAEFDDEYKKYNDIQLEQKFDLTPYAGKRAKRWTYDVKNHPDYENNPGCVQANILVYDGLVIGGDICSVELNGFIHGFDFPQSAVTETVAETTAAAVTETTAATPTTA